VLSKLPLANAESSGDQLRSTYFKHGEIDPKLMMITGNVKAFEEAARDPFR